MATPADKPLNIRQERLLDVLPSCTTQLEAGIKAGYAPASAGESVSENLRRSNVIAALEDRKRTLQTHVVAAQAHFAEHTVEIAKAMVQRAEGKDRDSQRAGERILETVGVLQKEPLVVVHDPSMDAWTTLASLMALQMREQAEAKERPLPSIEAAVRRVLGPGEAER